MQGVFDLPSGEVEHSTRPPEVPMDDKKILERINALVDEEHQLRSETDADTPADAERLQRLEETLDQCWDLLRQRRAKRQYGEDDEAAAVRDAGTVEGYQQ
jgi:hypothetical protein